MLTFISVSYLIKKFSLGSLIRPKSKQGALTGLLISSFVIMIWLVLAPLYLSAEVVQTFVILIMLGLGYFTLLYANSLDHLYKNCSI